MIRPARRLASLPPYLFAEIDRMKREAVVAGTDIISFGIGDPDLPAPDVVVEEVARRTRDSANHQYPSYEGHPEFRRAAAEWCRERYGVPLDPDAEVLSLIGSKEGIGHTGTAFVDPGDTVLVPDPGYPVYHAGTIFAEGKPYAFPLDPERGFLPDLERIPADVASRARLLWINYPNNPTGAVADLAFHERAVAFCRKHGILLCSDAAYAEMGFDGFRPPSVLEVKGAKDVAIEYHSLSKTFNMTGFRVGFAIGNRDAIAALGAVKTNLDSGVFQPIQFAGARAYRECREWMRSNVAVYQRRRDLLVPGLRALGLDVPAPRATFYVWFRVPARHTSAEFVARLIREAGIVTTPGPGFGAGGEGYVRMTLTVSEARIREALERLRTLRF